MKSMTPTEIDNLPAGPELDRLVAEAIGRTIEREYICECCDNAYPHTIFRPSELWESAMEAAEKFGTFSVYQLTKEGNDWVVGEIDAMVDDFRRIGVAPTGPLAIARAIAKIGATK